jgi:uncharacterized protein (TIRG00374 family)
MYEHQPAEYQGEEPVTKQRRVSGVSRPAARGKSLARIAVALACIGILLWVVDWRASLELLRRAAPAPMAMIILLAALGIAVSAWKWQRLLVAASIPAPYMPLVGIYWIAAFVSTFLPSVVPGDAVRIVMARRFGSPASIAGSIVVERITGLAVLLLLAAGAAIARSDLVLGDTSGAGTLMTASIGLAALLLLLVLASWALAGSRLGDEARWRQRVRVALVRFGTVLADLGRQPRALATAGGLSLVFYGTIALSHYSALCALGLEVSSADLAAVAPLVVLVAALPVAPSGLGIGEGAFVLLYAQIGVAPEAALAAAVLRRAAVTLVALTGGIAWLLLRKQVSLHTVRSTSMTT